MNSKIKFGWLSPVIGNRWSDHQPIVMYQEKNILPIALQHFDSLWIADHFYGFDAPTDPFMEAWTTLTWLAAKFPQVTLCHHVLGHGYRNPALTAKMAATLQVLSGDRLILGIGAGWREDEYRSYGYEFPRPAVRFAQLEELIFICRSMWSNDSTTFTGKYFKVVNASAPPRPKVIPPICIGASGEQIALPLVGRLADMWNASINSDEPGWIRKRNIVQDAAQKANRNPNDIKISITIERVLPETDADSESFRDYLEHLTELGIEHFVLDFGHPKSTEPVLRFVEQVIQPMKSQRK